MNKLIAVLLDTITTQQASVVQLALVLERSNLTVFNDDAYELNLSPQLMETVINADEQREIVKELSQDISAGVSNRAELFWVLGKISSLVAFKPVVSLIEQYAATFDQDTTTQALLALDNYLFAETRADLLHSIEGSKLPNLLSILQKLSHEKDERLARLGHRLLNHLQPYIS